MEDMYIRVSTWIRIIMCFFGVLVARLGSLGGTYAHAAPCVPLRNTQKAEENLLKRLLEKMEKEEAKKKPVDDKKATKELKKILGDVPEDVAKKLLDWKEKH